MGRTGRIFERSTLDADLKYVNLTEFENFNIVPFSKKSVIRDSVLLQQFAVAKELLQSYMLGQRSASEVFAVEKLVNFNTICNILGSHHALAPHNWRLFYNPISSRLEPIGFDANGLSKAWDLYVFEWAKNDLDYLRAYNKKVQELVENKVYENLDKYPGLTTKINSLQREFPDFKWDKTLLRHNYLVMKGAVLPGKSIRVFLEKMDDEQITFWVENFGKMPVELLKLQHENQRTLGNTEAEEIVMVGEKKLIVYQINKNFNKLFVNKKKRKSGFALSEDVKKLALNWRVIGTTVTRSAEILPWQIEDTALKKSFFARRAPKKMPNEPYLAIDEANKIINFKPGVWELTKTCLLPAGYVVQINSGCHLRFKAEYGQIISYSPVRFIGTKEEPVTFTSYTGKGGGIFVMGSPDTSIVKHCLFDGLGVPRLYMWSLSGAVNFFENPVKIAHCTFKNNRSEDGLNIINTYFEMDHVAFANTQSDAFDGDFVEGIISNTTFRNLGNDAIDISGSNLTVKKVIIRNAGDKALSAGEKSKMIAEDVLIENCEVAIASKDLSQIAVNQTVIRGSKLGFTAFQKKPEFGSCQIVATNILLENNELDYLIERNSSLQLNGKMMPVSDGVKARMYGVEFGKSSR